MLIFMALFTFCIILQILWVAAVLALAHSDIQGIHVDCVTCCASSNVPSPISSADAIAGSRRLKRSPLAVHVRTCVPQRQKCTLETESQTTPASLCMYVYIYIYIYDRFHLSLGRYDAIKLTWSDFLNQSIYIYMYMQIYVYIFLKYIYIYIYINIYI